MTRHARNLLNVRARATPQDVAQGRAWYFAARGELYDVAKRHGLTLKRAAYAAAALSNQIEWRQNVQLLENVAHALNRGRPPRGHYRQCLDKAARILTDGDFAALRGPKVTAFARALLGDMSAVVIDRWMVRAAKVRERPEGRRYDRIAASLREAARHVGEAPAVFQAIVWVTIKREA